ncbi:MAG TPA: hypothetical protein DEQ43_10120 [Nocardioides bacterium]|nr:hypothetical protein [Nocardioides sp.]
MSGSTDESGDAGPIRDSGLDAICVATAMTLGEDIYSFCDIPPDEVVALTPDMVAVAFARIAPPPPTLQIQPPNGRTLVNLDTNFYAETGELDRVLTLLGQRVELHIVAATFTWRFGDGDSLTTDQPGSPYPNLEVTHRYLAKGHVTPSVDTTYTAQFRVSGGPWRAVPGSVTVTGAPVGLEVLTATPTLVGYDRR